MTPPTAPTDAEEELQPPYRADAVDLTKVPRGDAEPDAEGRRSFALLPERLRPLGRPRLWTELALTYGGYKLYSWTRNAVPENHGAAMHRAHQMLAAERDLHVNIELTINHAADRVGWLIVGMNYYYATLHFIMTIGLLVWMYVRRPEQYRGARTALCAATGLALIGFTFYALAPPRFLTGEGFIDTVVKHHTWGSWGTGHVASLSNQYAAMPSVHIAWSTWCGVTLFRLAKHRWIKVLGLLYPLATCVVILSTANHFLADAVAGLITITAGFGIQRLLQGRPAYA